MSMTVPVAPLQRPTAGHKFIVSRLLALNISSDGIILDVAEEWRASAWEIGCNCER